MPRPSNAYVRDCCQDASRLNQLTVVIFCNLPASREKNLFRVPVDIRRRLSMNPSQVLLLAFLIGVVAGLRSLTAPAAVAWAAHRNWMNLHNTPLSFMGSTAAVVIFTLLAVVALVAVLGAVGGIAGAFAVYQVRTRLVRALQVPDLIIAFVEDGVAIGGGLFIVSRI